jgi:uncharacterized phage protein gp47/JayE
MLRLYSISELLAAAKSIIRSSIDGIGTEDGTDHDLTLNAAARMLTGAQVEGQHIYEQLEPRTADAENRDRMIDTLGLTFEREACPARGLVALRYHPSVDGTIYIPAGTEFTVPAAAFADGVERTFRTLEDTRQTVIAYDDDASNEVEMRAGSSIWKARPKHIEGSSFIGNRSLLRVTANGSEWLTVAKRVSIEDHSVDFLVPAKSAVASPLGATDLIALVNKDVVVAAECTTAGAAGNCPWTIAEFELEGITGCRIVIFEMSGGGDAVGAIDGDSDRVTRLLEDTIAYPPSFGNMQHWREIALSCPDVDLDDAIVYQHARGPGTVDIVCIGRSGGIRSEAFPDANISFCFWGNNTRRIGEIQAEKVEQWCKARAGYFIDLKVRSVEWDWRGNFGAVSGSSAFFDGVNVIDLDIEPHDGYGPDSGVAADIVPAVPSSYQLWPASGTVPDELKVGDRVWVTVGNSSAGAQHAFATVVTEVLGITSDRSMATIADVSALAPESIGHYDLENQYSLVIKRWGTAGPLTQPVLDAVFTYFDQLGPGSYLLPPKGPGYMKHFGSNVYPPAPGHLAVSRWPEEGRRWSSGLRASELRASILAIEGVKSVAIGAESDDLVDFDPILFSTLAIAGCVPRYA